jgi:hypothetical protein
MIIIVSIFVIVSTGVIDIRSDAVGGAKPHGGGDGQR